MTKFRSKASRKTEVTLHKKRNPVAQAPILRKGGVHEKSRKTKRQKQKSELRHIVRNSVAKTMATYRGHCSFGIWLIYLNS